jgi:hypothetical protein
VDILRNGAPPPLWIVKFDHPYSVNRTAEANTSIAPNP